MRNLFYIIACLLISIIVGLVSPIILPDLFNLDKADKKELEYIEVEELEPEPEIVADTHVDFKVSKDKKLNKDTEVVTTSNDSIDDYVEELPPETLFRINRYGKWEFWNYYRDVSRIKFSKNMRNLYEETYSIKNSKNPKFKYSIHILASKKTTSISQLKLDGLYENFDNDENLYRYFYRSYDNYWICRRELRDVRSKGFPDAYIVKL